MKRKIQLLVLAAAMSLNFSVPALAEDIEGIQSEETFEAGFESQPVIIENEPSENGPSENETFGNEPSDEDGMDDGQEDESIDGEITEELPEEGFFSDSDTKENFETVFDDESDMEKETSEIALFSSLEEETGENEFCSWVLNEKGVLRITPKKSGAVRSPYSLDTYGKIKKVVIEEGFTSIARNAFDGLGYLTEVVIPNSVTFIDSNAFTNCRSLKNVNLPDSITKIGAGAFGNCSSLETIEIPDSVSSMGSSVFQDCISLTSVKLSENLTEIPDRTFASCSNLSIFTIPKKVETIGVSAFYATGLNSIELPKSVREIKRYAFCTIPSLTSVRMNDGVEKINEYAFSDGNNLKIIDIPASVTEISENAFWRCKNLTTISVDPYNQKYTTYDGALFTKDKTILKLFPAGNSGSYTVPDGCKVIGENAFAYSKLTEIILPQGVTEILYGAFSDCKELSAISLPTSLQSIGRYVFYRSSLNYINIPEGVTSIGESAFNQADICVIELPRSLNSIGDRAFISPSLKEVIYAGTETEWENISVDYSVNGYLKNATKHYAVIVHGKCGDSAYWYLD